jgi:DNA-binding NarL/FixJ family response regulator
VVAESADPVAVSPVRVAIVDDDTLVRGGLATIIDLEPDLAVVGDGSDGADVGALVRRTSPDVVLMDVRMPRIDGITATRRLTERGDGPAVIVITTFENDDHVVDALVAGARGFVLKRATPDDLLTAIRTVAHTDSLVFPEAIRRVATARAATPAPAWADRLTDRERDVLGLVCAGLTNAEIADRLVVSPETVKSHLSALLAKSGTRHRTELVVRAFQGGLAG